MARFFAFFMLATLSSRPSIAQKSLTAASERFLLAAKDDTAYSRFRAESNALAEKANGRATNAAEALRLFGKNKSLLERVNRQYRRQEILARSVQVGPLHLKQNPEIARIPGRFRLIGSKQILKTPYQEWGYVFLANATTVELLKNDVQTGAIDFSVLPNTSWAPSMKDYHRGFRLTATVPNDPSVIAARVQLDYSFYYTGWDTYGANSGMQLVFGPGKEFISPALNASLDTAVFASGYNIPYTRFNIMNILVPMTSITDEVAEVHAEKEGTVTVEGYVKPNETIKFAVGVGYMHGSVYGVNGHYLYGEFRLKKATITYLKTLNN